MPSYCVICEAPPQGCDHTGLRYLDDVVYYPVDPENPFAGWVVPEHEQARWNAAPLRIAPRTVNVEARDVDDLLEDLHQHMIVGDKMEAKFRSQHDRDPVRVTRMVSRVLELCATSALRNPGGFLWTQLVALENKT